MTADELTLAFDPFASDFGDQSDKVMKNKLGKARKAGPCTDCAQTIRPGEKVRMLAGVYDGQLRSYRWCAACCDAMALSFSDDGAALEARFAMRRAAAQGTATQAEIDRGDPAKTKGE